MKDIGLKNDPITQTRRKKIKKEGSKGKVI